MLKQNQKQKSRSRKPSPPKRIESQAIRANGNSRRVIEIADHDDIEPDYFDDDALAGVPALAVEPPTAWMKIHAVFTAQHVITELRYQFEMGTLTRADCEMLAQLGKEIAAELKEN